MGVEKRGKESRHVTLYVTNFILDNYRKLGNVLSILIKKVFLGEGIGSGHMTLLHLPSVEPV